MVVLAGSEYATRPQDVRLVLRAGFATLLTLIILDKRHQSLGVDTPIALKKDNVLISEVS